MAQNAQIFLKSNGRFGNILDLPNQSQSTALPRLDRAKPRHV